MKVVPVSILMIILKKVPTTMLTLIMIHSERSFDNNVSLIRGSNNECGTSLETIVLDDFSLEAVSPSSTNS